MNEAVNRFIEEMGAVYAEEGDRDVSPILFKADNESAGMLFELTLPKGEPHPYWRVREREMTPEQVTSLASLKATYSDSPPESNSLKVGMALGSSWKIRGYVYNARERGVWNLSVDKAG